MAFKMKGPSLYPNYGKGKKGIKLNRGEDSMGDGRASSSPFQVDKDEKKKATSTHFADGTKKSARDKFNDEENRKEQLLNQGFTPSDADSMIKSGAVTGRVNPNKPVKPTDADMKKYSDLEKYDDDNPTGKAKPKKKKKK